MPKTREQKVDRWVRLWQSRWLLDHWDITIIHEKGTKPGSDWCWASCQADLKYNCATIYIYQPFWADGTTDALRSGVLCHEVAHILTWPLASLAARAQSGLMVTQHELTAADEVTTEHIAKALSRQCNIG